MSKTHLSHPGGILKRRFLDECGLSVSAASRAMGIPRTRLNDIVLERRDISAETALILAKFFGNSASFWMNLQMRYDLAVAEKTSAARIKSVMPYQACA